MGHNNPNLGDVSATTTENLRFFAAALRNPSTVLEDPSVIIISLFVIRTEMRKRTFTQEPTSMIYTHFV